MKLTILTMFLQQLFSLITPDIFKNFIDSGLDYLENAIAKSENTYDDATILPIIKLIRTTFDIPDVSSDTDIAVPILTNKSSAISTLLSNLFTMVDSDMMKGFVDAGLDVIENAIAKSENTYDDIFILPVISLIRTTFDIPDNDAIVPVTTATA